MTRNNLQNHLLALATLGLLLSSCATPTSIPDPTIEPVAITFACFGYELSAYEALAEKFHAANPDVTVQFVLIEDVVGSDSSMSSRQLMSAADTLAWEIEPYMTRRGLLKDLTPFIEADWEFQPEDFYPNALESLQWDGGTWGLPAGVEFELIFYDKQAFDAAGVSYPEPGWTWDDFLEKATLLTERDGQQVTRWGFVGIEPNPFAFVAGRVDSLVDRSTTPAVPRLDRPAVVEAARWYTDLHLEHRVMPYFEPSQESSGYPSSEGELLVLNGRAAMWSDRSTSFERRGQRREIGVAPYPIEGLVDGTTPISVRPTYAMSAGTSHPEESWRWLSFLSRQPAVNVRSATSLPLPARRSVAEEIDYWENLDDKAAPAYRFAVEHSLSQSVGYEVTNALNDALNVILQEEKGVETALAEAQTRAQRAITEHAQVHRDRGSPLQPGSVPTPEPESDEGVDITFALFFTYADPYRRLAETFHEVHPEITVKVREPSSTEEFGVKGMASFSDCFFWYNEAPDEEDLQHILNLDPFLEADSDFPLDDFYPQTLDAFRRRGDLWALPAEVQIELIYYNKDLFDAADVPYPQAGWNLEQFLSTAKALTREGGSEKQYGFLSIQDDASELKTFASLMDAFPMDTQSEPPRPRFDDSEVIEAVRWYAELATVHGVKPIFPGEDPTRRETIAWDSRHSLVNENRVALWSRGGVFPGYLPSDLRVGVVPLPLARNGVPGWYVKGYYISNDTPYPQQCWEWIQFLSEHSAEVAEGLPAWRSAAESPTFRARVGEEKTEALLFSMAHLDEARPWYEAYADGPPYYWFTVAYGQILEGEEPSIALAEAQAKTEAFVACLETRPDPTDEEAQDACAKEVDPSYRGWGRR